MVYCSFVFVFLTTLPEYAILMKIFNNKVLLMKSMVYIEPLSITGNKWLSYLLSFKVVPSRASCVTLR